MPAEHGENNGPRTTTSTASTNNRGNNSNNESGSVDRNKNKGSRGGGGGEKSSSSRRKGQAFTPASKSLFFQSVTGEYIYLHPFNVKSLLHQYGKVQNFPGTRTPLPRLYMCLFTLYRQLV
jgi:hypothetical protein